MKKITHPLLLSMLCMLMMNYTLKADCTFASLTLDQVTLNNNNTYDITMTFCAGGGFDPCTDVTGAFGFMLEGGASILSFPPTLTSPQTNETYVGFLYNNSVDSLIYFDNGQYAWWTCVDNSGCGPLQAVCQSITITTDILPSKITCGGMEGVGVLVAPYSCTGPNLEVYPNPNYPPPVPCSSFTLVADAGNDQDVFYTYNNSECTSLSVTSTGNSTPPLSYEWSTNEVSTSINVCPGITTTYSVTITDGEGCTTSDDVTVNVEDITCGNNKVLMCKPNGTTTRCIRKNKVNNKLNNGWTLGPCSSSNFVIKDDIELFTLNQNFSNGQLNINVREYSGENISIYVHTFNGQLVKNINSTLHSDNENVNVKMNDLDTGLFIVSIYDEDGLIKSEKFYK